MNWLDRTFPTPAENLACDEALLDFCEAGLESEILRCWEPAQHFVVVGYGERAQAEVNLRACEARGIPVLRRTSGGGTVLQGPGCLNYSLVLKIDGAPPLRSIVSTNRYIMERNRAVLQTLIQSGQVEVRGHTDLVLNGRKFSGNAQRRGKRFLLFHGTVLCGFDLGLIQETLPMPSRRPVYRQERSHQDFLVNLGLPAEAVKRALQEAWNALEPCESVPWENIASLAREKYASDGWNLKF